MTDLLLAVAHHLLAFGLAAILAAEFAITFPGLTGPGLRRLKNLDRFYGAAAGLLVVIGILRVLYGGKGPEFYMQSPFFWAKMAAFAAAGLLSVPPTLQVIAWGKSAAADPGFTLPPDEVASVRTYLSAELFLFALIPTFAAMMARGVGL